MDNVKILLKPIIKKGNKFLILKRSADDKNRPNCWDFPGGNLEFGENAMEALKREIKEESNLSVKNIKPLQVISEKDKKKNLFWVRIGYTSEYSGGEVKISEEHNDYKWVTKAEFLKLESADYLMEFAKNI
jgi:ADP-ribose pyrophosphatase YjhB (NUDIX family)